MPSGVIALYFLFHCFLLQLLLLLFFTTLYGFNTLPFEGKNNNSNTTEKCRNNVPFKSNCLVWLVGRLVGWIPSAVVVILFFIPHFFFLFIIVISLLWSYFIIYFSLLLFLTKNWRNLFIGYSKERKILEIRVCVCYLFK